MKSKRLLKGWLFAVFMANNFFLSAHVQENIQSIGLQQVDLKPKELQQDTVQLAGRFVGRGGGRSSGGPRGGRLSGFRSGSSRGGTSFSGRRASSSSRRPAGTSTSRTRTVQQSRGGSRTPSATRSRARGGRFSRSRGSRGRGRWGRGRWAGRGRYRGGYWRYSGFAVGFAVGAGIGIGLGYWGPYFHNPLAPFWGPRIEFGWGGYYYANYGCWYYGPGSYWYYPWNGCFFYPNYACWYYPNMGVTVYYEPKKAERYAIVDNDDSRDAYFALYYKVENGKGHNLYGVGTPQVIGAHETVKAVLPSYGSSKDFIVIVDRSKDSFKETLVQDEKGNLVTDQTVSEPRPSKVKDVDIVIEKLDKNAAELQKIRQEIHTQKGKLLEVEKLAKEAKTDKADDQKESGIPAVV